MGTKKEIKLYFLMGLFFVTSVLAYQSMGVVRVVEKPAMKNYFSEIEGYTVLQHIPLEASAFSMLNLDDYVYIDYMGPTGKVNLYVGYYYSATKAYASHSPLICYPSQGWKIDQKPKILSLNVGPHVIHYEEITTSLGMTKEVVLYWYQAYQQTNIQVYKNKLDMGYNKFVYGNEQHAFVRVSVPFSGGSAEKAHQDARQFIQVFYPQFLEYIDAELSSPSPSVE